MEGFLEKKGGSHSGLGFLPVGRRNWKAAAVRARRGVLAYYEDFDPATNARVGAAKGCVDLSEVVKQNCAPTSRGRARRASTLLGDRKTDEGDAVGSWRPTATMARETQIRLVARVGGRHRQIHVQGRAAGVPPGGPGCGSTGTLSALRTGET